MPYNGSMKNEITPITLNEANNMNGQPIDAVAVFVCKDRYLIALCDEGWVDRIVAWDTQDDDMESIYSGNDLAAATQAVLNAAA